MHLISREVGNLGLDVFGISGMGVIKRLGDVIIRGDELALIVRCQHAPVVELNAFSRYRVGGIVAITAFENDTAILEVALRTDSLMPNGQRRRP